MSIVSCSSRKDRGTKQNLFLIENLKTDKKYDKKYVVMGSTGNVYMVNISNSPTCTCPDHQTRHKRCKHIYFILIRVMKVTPSNEEKEKFTNNDLDKMFENIPEIMVNLIADGEHKKKYDKNKVKITDNSNNSKMVDQKPIDDICPICLDDLDKDDDLDYCKYSCGKSIHKKCFSMWAKSRSSQCVFCRESWLPVISTTSEKYLNLN